MPAIAEGAAPRDAAPHFVFASDSFKGSLSSADTARLLRTAAERHFPGCTCTEVPMADGGEGTCAALVAACGGELREVAALDALGRPVQAAYALLPGGRAVVEMAAASGLPLLAAEERDPLRASTFGTGQLVADALAQGVRDLTIALGGSATNDGGMGFLRALGVRFFDAQGEELPGIGADLARVARIDANGLAPELVSGAARVSVMCDVDNPLLGPQGATYTFGPQKGADAAMLAQLEAGMAHYAELCERTLGRAVDVPGAGAAGGLGAACLGFLGAELVSGVERVLELVGFGELLASASLVVTGEGFLDEQTAHGKVVAGVGKACAVAGVPCVAIVGGVAPSVQSVPGVTAIVPTETAPMPLEEAIERAEELYAKAAERMFALAGVRV